MRNNKLYLIHIAECLARINRYLIQGKVDFMENQMIQDAVLRNLEMMGESIKQLPQEWKETEPRIEWVKIGNFTNILADDYLGIDLETVWFIIENYLPDLEQAIKRIDQQFGKGGV